MRFAFVRGCMKLRPDARKMAGGTKANMNEPEMVQALQQAAYENVQRKNVSYIRLSIAENLAKCDLGASPAHDSVHVFVFIFVFLHCAAVHIVIRSYMRSLCHLNLCCLLVPTFQ